MSSTRLEWQLGPRIPVSVVTSALGMSMRDVSAAAIGIDRHGYTQFVLESGRKRRVIAAPHDWLKRKQRALLDHLLTNLQVADCVYSQRGRDVIQNASQHLSRQYMAVLDIEDCFPSTTFRMVRESLDRAGFDDGAAGLITRLTTLKSRLPQGAPTSPVILNCVLGPTDFDLTSLATEYGATFTRYMDDLCFSADVPLTHLARRAARLLNGVGYSVNPNKVHMWGPHDRHTVTKIVVASSLQAEPSYLTALASEIRKIAARDLSPSVIARVHGKVQWISRLDSVLGKQLATDLRLAVRKARHPSACLTGNPAPAG